MADSKPVDVPELGFWEKADLSLAQLTIATNALMAAITGVFRGSASPKKYSHHITAAAIRRMCDRTSDRQKQAMFPPSTSVYTSVMQKRGLEPEIQPSHPIFEFWLDLLQVVNDSGHDIAVFFPRYTLTPYGTYPTQLRQATEALRYILNETGRSPGNVVVGGDSAGGNLAMATLLHLSHPHPEIEPISLSEPLAGVFGFAPWINFSHEGPSFKENEWKDILTRNVLNNWSASYLGGKVKDNWNEPDKAPAEWWQDAKTERILILAGGDEILLSPIEQFAKKIKSVFPNTTYVVGYDEAHDAPFYTDAGSKEGTQTSRELRKWIASRL
ncbi:uncharacterized protein N7477_002572 [Penicillium maclennaniae]|uniref:uncharacterized protein n=1 Tax=Penicillium maclennaniae TaxID=1343394 RepID=UPI00254240B0|nr:uncharacterized protein N7477_002572 [Penicillium maclennaniae]KAJ5676939.1 hypothetical protein N7477_002572 [Penicillium maclennaniae]